MLPTGESNCFLICITPLIACYAHPSFLVLLQTSFISQRAVTSPLFTPVLKSLLVLTVDRRTTCSQTRDLEYDASAPVWRNDGVTAASSDGGPSGTGALRATKRLCWIWRAPTWESDEGPGWLRYDSPSCEVIRGWRYGPRRLYALTTTTTTTKTVQ